MQHLRPGRCRIFDLMRDSGIDSLRDLSFRVDINESQLSQYANNHRLMTLPIAKILGEHFDVPIDDLYEWEWVDRKDVMRRRKIK